MRINDLFRTLFRRQSCKNRPHTKRRPASCRLNVEALEDRVVPSSIIWTNRGQTSDNFATVFGSNAAAARSVVDAAIGEWDGVIGNFNQVNHPYNPDHSLDNNYISVTISMNTDNDSQGGVTNNVSTDANGKPTAATISIGRNGAVIRDAQGVVIQRDAWYLNSTLFTSSFLGTPTNAFAGYAQAGSAAAGKWDMMEVVTHELSHAIGFYANTQVNAHCTDTGVVDQTSVPTDPTNTTRGHYYLFTGTGGFHALLTSFNTPASDTHGGEHFAAPGAAATVGGTTYYGADDLMNPYYNQSQRHVVSREDAYVLRDAYGYTVNDPATTLGTFYAVRDETGTLTVRGRQDASSDDSVTIGTATIGGLSYVTTSVALGSPDLGTGYTGAYTDSFRAAFIGNIRLQTGQGSSAVNIITSYTAPITVVSNGPATVNVGSAGNAVLVQAPVTVTNTSPVWLSQVVVDDRLDNTFESVTLDKTTIGGAVYGTITGLTGGTVAYKASDTGTVTVHTGADPGVGLNAATVDVQATVNLTTISGHGHNVVTVGKNHRLDDVQISLTINNTSFTRLAVDDSQDTVLRDIVMENAAQVGYGQITGLQPATIQYKYADVSTLGIETGVGPSALDQAAAVAVRANGVPTSLTGHGLTTITIGNAGYLTDIGRDVTVTNTTSTTDLVSDDSADATPRTVTVDDLTVSYGNPNAILRYSHLSSLTLNNGTGGSSTYVSATGQNEPVTIVNQSAGYVYVGKNHKLQDVKGDLTVRNQTGSATIELDDAADPLPHDGLLHDEVLTPQIKLDTYTPNGETVHGKITGLAPAAINYRASGAADVIVRGGIGDDANYNAFDAESTPAGVQSDLYGNGHATQFSVAADTDAGLNGPVALHGNSTPGTSSFAVYYDYLSPGGQTYTLTANSVSRGGVASVTYANLGYILLAVSSSGGNTINVLSNAAGVAAGIQAADGDHVNIGSTAPVLGGTLSAIHGGVEVNCYDFANVVALAVDDSGNTSTAARNVTFDQPYIALPNSDPSIAIRGLTADPNAYLLYNLGATSSVTVLGSAGNTTYHMKDFLANVPLTLTGGSGKNTLDYSAATGNVYVNLQTGAATDLAGVSNITNAIGASGGPAGSYNILVGGGAVDGVLTGGNGRRNLLIAGSTAATLNGGDGEDILIGGTTNYDAYDAALQAIMTEWTRTDETFDVRVQRLTDGVDDLPLVDATTVTGNSGNNSMSGHGGLAWIFTDGLDTINGFDPASHLASIVP